jgi:3-deoxy-D-manno-octulosonic-acid transferase
MSRARLVYSLAWLAALPGVALYLLWRSLRQREYRSHWPERFLGAGARPPDAGPVVWLHAVSVGETRAAQPLIESLMAARPAGRAGWCSATCRTSCRGRCRASCAKCGRRWA